LIGHASMPSNCHVFNAATYERFFCSLKPVQLKYFCTAGVEVEQPNPFLLTALLLKKKKMVRIHVCCLYVMMWTLAC